MCPQTLREAPTSPMDRKREQLVLDAVRPAFSIHSTISHSRFSQFNNYEVLVAEPGTYKWVPCPPGEFNIAAIWSENGKLARPIVVEPNDPVWGVTVAIRAYHDGVLIPGRAADLKPRWVGWGGITHHVVSSMCEVLCYAS